MKSRNVAARFSCAGGIIAASVHMKPLSSLHAAEQPSPSFRLPSSHASGASLTASPHFDAQVPVAQSGSSVHAAEQPSPSMTLPSSHASAPSFLLSPQTDL